jgi:flagellar motor switch protein FliN/FliY
MPAKKRAPKSKAPNQPKGRNRASEVNMEVAIELGRTHVPIDTILTWREGSLFTLPKLNGEAADLRVNGHPFGKGEVVTIGNTFGVRLTEILNC